jgi:LuxR family maltose regulon positive regulatory protein
VQHNMHSEAVEHALSAGDAERAARLIENAAQNTLMRSELATLLRWMDRLPEEQVRLRPSLCIYHAWALLLTGGPLEAVESRLQDAGLVAAAGQVSAEAIVFRALIANLMGDVRHSLMLSRQALERLPEDNLFLKSIAHSSLGMALVLNGNIEGAIQAFETSIESGQKIGNVMFAVASMCNLAGLCHAQGQLHRAEAIFQRALELATDIQGRRLPIAARALLGLGEVSRERNELEAAARLFEESLELFIQYGEMGTLVGYLHLARIKQAQGDAGGANEMIQNARHLALKSEATQFDDLLVGLSQVRIWLEQGNIEAASRWMEEHGLDRITDLTATEDMRAASSASNPLVEVKHITWARVCIAQGRPGEALEMLGPLSQAAEKQARNRRLIEILILQALAHQAGGDIARALSKLKPALALAEPEGYVRTFVDEGEPMARLLYEAASQGIAPKYAGQLLAAFEEAKTATDVPESRLHQPEMIEALSEREVQVLHLLAEGLSNREIAERLFVSLSTVKGHTANIYGKLAVNNRTQAVVKARLLGLFP